MFLFYLFEFIFFYNARILSVLDRNKTQVIYRKNEDSELFRKLALQIRQTNPLFNELEISAKVLTGSFSRASLQKIGLSNIEPSCFQEPNCSQARDITKMVVVAFSDDSQGLEQIEVINFPKDEKFFYRMEIIDRNYVSRTPSANSTSITVPDSLGCSSCSNHDIQTAHTDDDNDDLEKSHRQ